MASSGKALCLTVGHVKYTFFSPRGIEILKMISENAWMAQSVGHLTSAQVVISQLVNLSLASGSVLTAQSLFPVSDSVSPSLSAPPRLTLCLSLSQN